MRIRAAVLASIAFALPVNAQIVSPAIRLRHLVVSDPGAREIAARVLGMNFGRYRACYDEALRTTTLLDGRVRIRIEVANDGTVPSTSVLETSRGMQSVAVCAAHASETLSFPTRPAPWRMDVDWVFFIPDGRPGHAGMGLR